MNPDQFSLTFQMARMIAEDAGAPELRSPDAFAPRRRPARFAPLLRRVSACLHSAGLHPQRCERQAKLCLQEERQHG